MTPEQKAHRMHATPGGWQEQAACADKPTAWWFKAKWEKRAKAICMECPVRGECSAAGRYELAGIWGGRNVEERHGAVWLCEWCDSPMAASKKGMKRFCSGVCRDACDSARKKIRREGFCPGCMRPLSEPEEQWCSDECRKGPAPRIMGEIDDE